MQRKSTNKTRGANAKEKAFMVWVKTQPCSFCNHPSPSIADHVKGSTFRHQKRLIGHIFINSKCEECDKIVTFGTRKHLHEKYGINDSEATLKLMDKYAEETGIDFEIADHLVIHDVYALNQDVTDWQNLL